MRKQVFLNAVFIVCFCILLSTFNLVRKDTGISRIYMFINQIHNKLEALTNKMTKYLKKLFPLHKDVLLKFKLFKQYFNCLLVN